MSSNCQSPWQVTHARRCHLSPPATLCHRLRRRLLPPPPVATIFGQITCFKVPLAKPASQQANEAKELSFSFSALSRDMRPPTVPVRPAPTWTPSPSLSLSLWRVVVCKLFASLLSRGINLQAIDRCCQRASQAKTQTNVQTEMLFLLLLLLLLLLLPTLACQSALLWQDKIIYSAAPLPLSSCSLAAIVHAGIGQRSFIASCGSGRWL